MRENSTVAKEHKLVEAVAKAIYYANFRMPLKGNFAPTWEAASSTVRVWVRNQARAAIIAREQGTEQPGSVNPPVRLGPHSVADNPGS